MVEANTATEHSGHATAQGAQAMTTVAEKKHMDRVADLGCAVCRRTGYEGTPAELHHPRAGTGAGRRSSHMDVIPLCPEHHRGKTGLHGLGTKGFVKHYGYSEADLLDDTQVLLDLEKNNRIVK